MNRREFLPYAAALLAAGATALAAEARRRIGLQLFSIPKMLEKDFREGITFREKNGLAMSGTVTSSFFVVRVRRLFAAAFGEYPSCCTALSTRRRVASETFSGELRTRDTVAVDTSACAATSRIVGIFDPWMRAASGRPQGADQMLGVSISLYPVRCCHPQRATGRTGRSRRPVLVYS